MIVYYFVLKLNYNIIVIQNYNAISTYVFDCIFLYILQFKIVLKIRGPPVLYLNKKIKNRRMDMKSNFENILKQLFIDRYGDKKECELDKNIEIEDVSKEFKNILDKIAISMIYDSFENENIIHIFLKLSKSERIILEFNIILEMDLLEISYLLDTNISNVYTQKSRALKKLKKFF